MTVITQQARDIAFQAFKDHPRGTTGGIREGDDDDMAYMLAVQRALDAPRPAMSEDEMLQRARRAWCNVYVYPQPVSEHASAMRGDRDAGSVIQCALAALRDLDKPIVDPVVLTCREIVARESDGLGDAENDDNSHAMRAAVAAYKAGQEAGK